VTGREFLERLRVAAGSWGWLADEDDWEWDVVETIYPTSREIPANLFTMRRVAVQAPPLLRIMRAGEALSLSHLLRRVYSDIGRVMMPLQTPLLANLKKDLSGRASQSKNVKWGGNGMYWDVTR
jgi:hypothetical protein